jgi:hypothetical protein
VDGYEFLLCVDSTKMTWKEIARIVHINFRTCQKSICVQKKTEALQIDFEKAIQLYLMMKRRCVYCYLLRDKRTRRLSSNHLIFVKKRLFEHEVIKPKSTHKVATHNRDTKQNNRTQKKKDPKLTPRSLLSPQNILPYFEVTV